MLYINMMMIKKVPFLGTFPKKVPNQPFGYLILPLDDKKMGHIFFGVHLMIEC